MIINKYNRLNKKQGFNKSKQRSHLTQELKKRIKVYKKLIKRSKNLQEKQDLTIIVKQLKRELRYEMEKSRGDK